MRVCHSATPACARHDTSTAGERAQTGRTGCVTVRYNVRGFAAVRRAIDSRSTCAPRGRRDSNPGRPMSDGGGLDCLWRLCGQRGERYRAVALPSIERVASPDDILLTESGERGICNAYNRLIERARSEPSCEALVLLHDDCEIVDGNFRAKAIANCSRTGVGVTGVVGGKGLRDLAWWRGRGTAGAVFETRGYISEGSRQADVDAVDGLLMILSPEAFRNSRVRWGDLS